jgi:predicted DNA-binding transcriptional regulator YafY
MNSAALDNALLILEILKRIPRRRFTTSAQLHTQIEALGLRVSMRTMQRHLDAITQRFPVECDARAKPYGYRWQAGAQGLNLPQLSPAEALLLRLAQADLERLLPRRTLLALAPLFDSARRRLDDDAGDAPSARAERRWLGKVRRIPEGLPAQAAHGLPAALVDTLGEALYHERMLSIRYRNARGKASSAEVMPLGLVQQGHRLYLVARFSGHADTRVLALPRIQQAQLGAPFAHPRDFDLDAFLQQGHFGVRRGPPVRLAFRMRRAEARHLVEYPIAADQTVEDDGSDWLHVRATLPDTELLRRWLRGHADVIDALEITPVAG